MGPPQPTRRKSITHRNLHCPTAQPVYGRGESEVCNAKTAILGSPERPGLASQLSQASRTRPHVGRRFRPHRGTNCGSAVEWVTLSRPCTPGARARPLPDRLR
jgi:hypothetical protein